MIERALAAGVPFEWVATDTVYGVGQVEMQLRRAGKGYVLGAHATDQFNLLDRQSPKWPARPSRSRRLLLPRPGSACRPAIGTKGPRLYDWAYVELADLEAEEYNEDLTGLWTRGLLIRRSLS